jgi:hypothetical protein
LIFRVGSCVIIGLKAGERAQGFRKSHREPSLSQFESSDRLQGFETLISTASVGREKDESAHARRTDAIEMVARRREAAVRTRQSLDTDQADFFADDKIIRA